MDEAKTAIISKLLDILAWIQLIVALYELLSVTDCSQHSQAAMGVKNLVGMTKICAQNIGKLDMDLIKCERLRMVGVFNQ